MEIQIAGHNDDELVDDELIKKLEVEGGLMVPRLVVTFKNDVLTWRAME